MAGRVHASSGTFALSMPHIRSGKLRAIAVTSKERVPVWQDMPTVAEQGVPDFVYSSWVGVSGPRGMAPAVINKLNTMFVQTLKDPKIIKTLENDGTIMVGSSPEVLRQHIVDQTRRWSALIRDTGIQFND